MTTKLKTTRLAAVRKVMTNHGINYGVLTFMTLHELAVRLNDTWQVEQFLSETKIQHYRKELAVVLGQPVKLPRPHVCQLYTAIRHAVKGNESRPRVEMKISPRNGIEYVLLKR